MTYIDTEEICSSNYELWMCLVLATDRNGHFHISTLWILKFEALGSNNLDTYSIFWTTAHFYITSSLNPANFVVLYAVEVKLLFVKLQEK